MTVNTMSPVAAPVALARPHSITHHGITVSDDYAWLRDPGYPDVKDADVLDYLARENAWFEAAMAPHKGLTDALFAEMKGRIKEDDSSVPQKDGDYIYWRAFETGAQYRKWYRRPVAAKDDGSADQLILDEPALAQGHDYFRLGAMSVSSDGRYLAYAIDNDGSERFEARIKDLFTGEILPESIPDTLSSLVWTSDSKGLLYGLANDNWRTDNARLHWLGQSIIEERLTTAPAADFNESQDEEFGARTLRAHLSGEVTLTYEALVDPLSEHELLQMLRRDGAAL